MSHNQINYITSIIGALSLMTGVPCSIIYNKLQSVGLINSYLAPAYDVLHTFSLDYVAEDILEMLKQKGVSLC